MYQTAIYPGSFDPVTNGHLSIIKRALKLFDRVIVAVINNPKKKPLFSVSDRVQMLEESCAGMANVEIDSFDGLLVEYAEQKKAKAIVRGLRAISDFDYEFQMALTNRKLDPEIETVFLMTDYKYSYLNASLVRQIARLGGDIKDLVPETVIEKLVNLQE
ncbi:pantetheine-phosphate adenylyltransferase [Candidatus Margulisiibacteriota bacterium]